MCEGTQPPAVSPWRAFLLTSFILAITVFGMNTLVYLYEQNMKSKADEVVDKTMPLILSLAVSSGKFSYAKTLCLSKLVAYPLHLVSNIQCIQGTSSILNTHPELTWLQILSKLYSSKVLFTLSFYFQRIFQGAQPRKQHLLLPKSSKHQISGVRCLS